MLSSRPHHAITEGPYYAPTKTPARLKGRAENLILHAGARTVGPKGKSVLKTPFAPGSVQPNRLLKEVLATQGKPGTSTRQNKPLGDKTPFPNRQIHNAQNPNGNNGDFVKIPKLVFAETTTQKGGATPEMQRPSSSRRHSRGLMRSAGKNSFQTPANNGRHWDVGDIDIASPEVQVQDAIPEDDLDEIEFMPPNTLGALTGLSLARSALINKVSDIPYQPPVDFDLPDYKALGEAFRAQVFSAPLEDPEPPQLVMPVAQMLDQSANSLSLKPLEDDDPFRLARAATAPPPPKPTTTSRIVSRSRPMSTIPPSTSSLRSLPQTARTRPATAASTLPPKGLMRPSSAAAPTSRRPMPSSTTAPRAAVPTSRGAAAASSNAKSSGVGLGRAPVRSAPMSRTASAPSTARSTPALRGAIPGKAKGAKEADCDPPLFREVGGELDEDFMFEV
ncbi:hypothetical protein D9611_010899 [Ephemerocybe angulata]|uniref:Uncharacterized protein n=1 Tax=Ephemerocybe angulata TaxID=980116 RepID=A0A8H5FG52_9AGAR|nr:hypothetical protein D9611_010899 [Tulosesus angulatus]